VLRVSRLVNRIMNFFKKIGLRCLKVKKGLPFQDSNVTRDVSKEITVE
jgi:hypothetical protein